MPTIAEGQDTREVIDTGTFVIITADNPHHPAKLEGINTLVDLLTPLANTIEYVKGFYDDNILAERSYIATFNSWEEARAYGNALCHWFGQDSYIVGHKSTYSMRFNNHNREQRGNVIPANSVTWFDTAPDLYYSQLVDGRSFSIDFQF